MTVEPTPEDLAPLRLKAAQMQLEKICKEHGWSMRMLNNVAGYQTQLVIRKPRKKGFGSKLEPEYVRATGKTELEAHLAMLIKLGLKA